MSDSDKKKPEDEEEEEKEEEARPTMMNLLEGKIPIGSDDDEDEDEDDEDDEDSTSMPKPTNTPSGCGTDSEFASSEAKAVVGSAGDSGSLEAKQQQPQEQPREALAAAQEVESPRHCTAKTGDLIGKRFEVVGVLGSGTFGRVYRCKDGKHNDVVALKVVSSKKYVDSAVIETKTLNHVYRHQKRQLEEGLIDREYCVKLFTRLYHDDSYCMAFEPLGPSLLDVLKWNDFRGLPLSLVANVGYQLMDALRFLTSLDLVHTDLKLENILFVDSGPGSVLHISSDVQHFFGLCTTAHQRKTGFVNSKDWSPGSSRHVRLPASPAIKIIDFGGAHILKGSDLKKSAIINTRQYRGPEVILDLGWSLPSDMWSAGCLLSEIWTGVLTFPAHDNLLHLAMMEKLLGPFPDSMVERARARSRYFCKPPPAPGSARDECEWQVTTSELSPSESGKVASLLPLDAEAYESAPLAALLKRMLSLDPCQRATPGELIDDPAFSSRTEYPSWWVTTSR